MSGVRQKHIKIHARTKCSGIDPEKQLVRQLYYCKPYWASGEITKLYGDLTSWSIEPSPVDFSLSEVGKILRDFLRKLSFQVDNYVTVITLLLT